MQGAFGYAKPKILLWLNYKCTNNSLNLPLKLKKKGKFAVQARDSRKMLD